MMMPLIKLMSTTSCCLMVPGDRHGSLAFHCIKLLHIMYLVINSLCRSSIKSVSEHLCDVDVNYHGLFVPKLLLELLPNSLAITCNLHLILRTLISQLQLWTKHSK